MYIVFKLIHIAAVILFLGNITTGLFWKAHADRTRNPQIIAHVMEGIIRSDRWFTLPGILILILGGVGAAMVGGIPILGTGWILWSIVLFSVSGLAYAFQVAPLQTRMSVMARASLDSDLFDWTRYHALSRAWELWGLFALLTPLAAVVLMVLKPALPAF